MIDPSSFFLGVVLGLFTMCLACVLGFLVGWVAGG